MAKDLVKPSVDISLTDNDFMMMFTMVIMVVVMSKLMAPLSSLVQSQQYTGVPYDVDLPAVAAMQWVNFVDDDPYHPWVTGSFYNEGPDTAYLSFNTPDRFSELRIHETWNISWIGAAERLSVIYYKTNAAGETALVRAKGKY